MSGASTRSSPALYLDSSALIKLVVVEDESPALLAVANGRDLITSELALTEVQRAIRRLLVGRKREPRERVVSAMETLLSGLAYVPVTRDLLVQAGAYREAWLRTLDAVHVASALAVSQDIESLVSYDGRQLQAAQTAGLTTLTPM